MTCGKSDTPTSHRRKTHFVGGIAWCEFTLFRSGKSTGLLAFSLHTLVEGDQRNLAGIRLPHGANGAGKLGVAFVEYPPSLFRRFSLDQLVAGKVCEIP